jgi:Putative ER transporter, 6TM, N-terminal
MSSWKDLLFIEKFRRGLNRRGISRDPSAVLTKSNHLSIVVAFRCWTAGWLCALVLAISPVEHSAVLAAFLSFILVFIKPPAEATIVFLAQSLLASVVLLITWAWCVLGLKFSHLARDHQQDQRIANATQGSILKQKPNVTQAEIDGMVISISIFFPDLSYSLQGQLVATVFEGAFLQPGPSAIWGVFLFIGIYGIFLIRAYQVRLFFVMVFSVRIFRRAHLNSPEDFQAFNSLLSDRP